MKVIEINSAPIPNDRRLQRKSALQEKSLNQISKQSLIIPSIHPNAQKTIITKSSVDKSRMHIVKMTALVAAIILVAGLCLKLVPTSTSLPEHLDRPKLRKLNLFRKPDINCLPEDLDLSMIEELDISFSKITRLPNNFMLPNLKRFDMSNTQITSWPQNLNLPKLEVWDMSSSPINSWPDNIKLPNLEVLNILETNISSLPEDLHLPKIKQFDYDSFRIKTALPENVRKATEYEPLLIDENEQLQDEADDEEHIDLSLFQCKN